MFVLKLLEHLGIGYSLANEEGVGPAQKPEI